jgi:glucosamine 6-phosphate synthetase-like amidotransferase/phosphosugar isomerase protein
VTSDEYTIFSKDARSDRARHAMDDDLESPELGAYAHFMLKEIAEQ